MLETWSSMDSNSPTTDSGPSASDDCTQNASTSGGTSNVTPTTPDICSQNKSDAQTDKRKDLTLPLNTIRETHSRKPHFLDDDFQTKSNLECRIPKPHFLDQFPSPDDGDEKSDITNPNFLDDEIDVDNNKTALPKRIIKTTASIHEEPPRQQHRSISHYGKPNPVRSSEIDKRASQLYSRGTWPGETDWNGRDTSSIRSFSNYGTAEHARMSSSLENKLECVTSLLSLLTLSPDNNADLSGPLLDMSRCAESCIAMRQAGCIPLLVQLIHSKLSRDTRGKAAKALRNIIHTQTDDKAGRREARVWRLLEQVREYCYLLEDVVTAKCEGREVTTDDSTKHPSQSVAALMKLSFDEEHRHVVCQLGGLQALASLVSGDQAAHGSKTNDNTCLTMRKYAGMTLTNLTFGDGNNKSLLCSFKDFMMALVDQLESPNDDMRQVTAAVLRNLSWRADTNSKQILREVGAVKGLTKAAMTCQKEATLKSVLSALWNLTAHCSMNKVALCSVDGALGFLVDMLSYDSPTKTLAIVENAGGIMRNVSSHIAVREDYRQILRERNCLGVLLQHLKSPSLTVVSNSCGTLWNLSARCPQDQQFLWDQGAVPMLRSLIHSKHKMIAMGSSAALKNLLNSKPGKEHIVALDMTARNMNLPSLPTLDARKQKALEQELDNNLAETCDNIEPVTSPSTSNREEKNLFSATERQIAMSLERHRMTSSSPLAGSLSSQISLSHSAHLTGYLSCSNTLLRGSSVQRSDSKDSVGSAGKVPVPTPRNRRNIKVDSNDAIDPSKIITPIPTPRSITENRTYHTAPGYDVDRETCDQPKNNDIIKPEAEIKVKESKKSKKEEFGDYQETDLDQPTDYSLRYAEHHSEGSDSSEVAEPSVHEDCVQLFATEGTPYETPSAFSTATSISDLRVVGKETKKTPAKQTKSDKERRPAFDTKFSSGLASPERPFNYCDEGTPGYFSRVSSLSSLGEPNDDALAKKNARASISVDSQALDVSSNKEKDASKAVTFACEPLSVTEPGTPLAFVQDTPLMFSRSSSLGSLPDCDQNDDQGSVVSEISVRISGLLSPSEIPDSPGQQSAALSPTTPRRIQPIAIHTQKEVEEVDRSVFSERATTFQVENTPAHFSTATSLSSLTIDDEHDAKNGQLDDSQSLPAPDFNQSQEIDCNTSNIQPEPNTKDTLHKGPLPQSDVCKVYCTEDTPAILSKNGSQSNLSVLSIISSIQEGDERVSSDSSNLSDDVNLLEECIQKGIDKVVKNKGPSSEAGSFSAYTQNDGPYRSLPAYLRSSTETVKMSHEFRNVSQSVSPPPPLPPKSCSQKAPPLPPRRYTDRKPSTSTPSKQKANLNRTDSLSSLDSFGSTDRELFEDVVRRGMTAKILEKTKSHSVERPTRNKNKCKKRTEDRTTSLTRSPYSYHGENGPFSRRGRYNDGPNSLPSNMEKSNSLSSLSNDSFGSTDKEIFERCVKQGMAKKKNSKVHALDRMQGDEFANERVLLEDLIAKGVQAKAKNELRPSADHDHVGGETRVVNIGFEPIYENINISADMHEKINVSDNTSSQLNESNESYALLTESDVANMCKSEALPDLLETSDVADSFARPDLTKRFEVTHIFESVTEPNFDSLLDDHKLDSMMASEIEREAVRLAAQLKNSQLTIENSITSLASLDLENTKAPSNFGSLSMNGSINLEDISKSQKGRKKSFSVTSMMKRALSNSFHLGSTENLDHSFLEHTKPPSEMDIVDMESSIISVSSITSDKEKTPVVFDLKQPVQSFPMVMKTSIIDLDNVNPPSLFNEMTESTLEEPTTTQPYEDCLSTLNITDIPSGSEQCTPIPSDISSVESTPKKINYKLTPKEKRLAQKDRYQTYVIKDTLTLTDNTLNEDYLTWTKSESERSEEYVTATETKNKRKLSAKQRRIEDRARYQTQTVEIHKMVAPNGNTDPQLEALKLRLAAKRTRDVERFRTRTISEDIPPSPTFVTRESNLENVETTTGYDSLSSNEPMHQHIEERQDSSKDVDSGHNEDDFELNSTKMQTYSKGFRSYLPVTESPAAVDMCVANNIKNIEMSNSFQKNQSIPSSSDFASFEGDSDEKAQSDSEPETPVERPKPKIVKPGFIRDGSFDSNDSREDAPKAIRGRKKPTYISPYRKNIITKNITAKSLPKPTQTAKKPIAATKQSSATSSPKKTTKIVQKAINDVRLPLERQGTFTKEENVPKTNKKLSTPSVTTSPSRLPQLNRYTRPLKKSISNDKPTHSAAKRSSVPSMRTSNSNQSLQSNDSTKTIALNKPRPGSTSSVNKTKEVESKIAGLWKRVEQTKKQTNKLDKRVWIGAEPDKPKLVRSSTFEGKPQAQLTTAPKQKTSIGIRVSQIPSLKPKTVNKDAKPSGKVFARKQFNGQS